MQHWVKASGFKTRHACGRHPACKASNSGFELRAQVSIVNAMPKTSRTVCSENCADAEGGASF